MRLVSKDDGTWDIQLIREMEFLMLNRIGDAADPGDCEEARQRLFPSPLGRAAMDDAEDEFVDDWKGLVRPDLERQFSKARDVVAADVNSIRGRKRNGEMEYRLTVPKKHADDWCSALNQARIVLHERYNLPDEDGILKADGGHEQWLAMLQSEIYGSILDFLVRRVLWLK